MAFESQSHDHAWHRWKGSFEDVAEVARQARELVSAATGDDVPLPTLAVSWKGRDAAFTIDEFPEAMRQQSRKKFEGIRLWVSSGGLRVSVTWRADWAEGVSLSVEGEDERRIVAAGVYGELRDLLDRGKRFARWDAFAPMWFLMGTLVLVTAGSVTTTTASDSLGKALMILAGLSLFISVAMFLTTVVFVPRLELLGSERPSRLDVWRGRVLKLSGFVAAAIAGALIDRWLS